MSLSEWFYLKKETALEYLICSQSCLRNLIFLIRVRVFKIYVFCMKIKEHDSALDLCMATKIGPEFYYSNPHSRIDDFQNYKFNLFYGVFGGKQNM